MNIKTGLMLAAAAAAGVVADDNSWDYLMFVQAWPYTTCATTSEPCSIPSDVTSFVRLAMHDVHLRSLSLGKMKLTSSVPSPPCADDPW